MLSWHGHGQLYLLYLPYVNSARVTNASSSLVRHIDILTVGKWRMASAIQRHDVNAKFRKAQTAGYQNGAEDPQTQTHSVVM